MASIAYDLAVTDSEVIDMNRRLSGGDASLNVRVGEDGDHEWGDMLVDEGQDQEGRSPRPASMPGAATCWAAPWTCSPRASATS